MQTRVASLAGLMLVTTLGLAQKASGQVTARDTVRLGEITVIGTAAELKELAAEVARQPGGASLVTSKQLRATRQANLKDALGFVPGVYVAPRFGAADESQISIRGSGLRNNFHARGVSILVNGMPYRNADGFSDFESLELMTTEAIQVYKGGNAFRYGGSTLGGAINLLSRTGYTASPLDITAQGGSHGFYKEQLSSGGESGKFDYYGSFAQTNLAGYRDWSEQSRSRVNLHTGYAFSDKLDARMFYLFAHVKEQLPGALTDSAFSASPDAADAGNKSNKWGRDYDLHHLGMQVRAQVSDHSRLEVSPYYQYRDIDHPIFQVINQQSKDIGSEVRLENSSPMFGRTNRLTVGVLPATMSMENHQYENVTGSHGALTKDQTDHAGGVAAWIENSASLSDQLTLVTGLKYDHQTRRTEDRFLSNGDQSDRREFNALLPRVGLMLNRGASQFFANVTRSYEPPLLLELNSLTVAGFIQLKAQDALTYEIGTRGQHASLSWDLSLYDAELKNEIVNQNVQPFPNAPFTVPTYRNARKTRHSGIEAGASYRVTDHLLAKDDGLTLDASWTYGRFRFVDDSLNSGKTIPGVPQHAVQTALRYVTTTGFAFTPTVEWVPGSYYTNSTNTQKNQGWTVVGARAEMRVGQTGLNVFVAGQNLTNRRYSGSVQVDAANGHTFESADPRSLYVGVHIVR